jgi:small conductance mechanosensitive channel
MEDHIEALDRVTTTALDLSFKYGPRIAVALGILALGWLAARWAGGVTERQLAGLKLDRPVVRLLVRVAKLGVFALFLIVALQNLGVELLPLIAGLGVAGAGIALAMQGVLSNIVAGLTIIFTKPFAVDDYVSIAGVEGRVEDISLSDTTLSHADRSKVVVPNRKIVGEILHNYGQIRQLGVVVGVSYDTDIGRALDTVGDVLSGCPLVLAEPVPVIAVARLGDSTVDIAVKPWVKVPDYGAASSEINRGIVEAFRARGIDIAFPQRVVRIAGGESGLRAASGRG